MPITPKAFEFVTKNLTIKSEIKEAARLVLVDNESRKEAQNQTGVKADSFGKALGRIVENLEKLLQENKLIMSNHIVVPELYHALTAVETETLDNRTDKKKTRKKNSK